MPGVGQQGERYQPEVRKRPRSLVGWAPLATLSTTARPGCLFAVVLGHRVSLVALRALEALALMKCEAGKFDNVTASIDAMVNAMAASVVQLQWSTRFATS